jgi:hypothetical protein
MAIIDKTNGSAVKESKPKKKILKSIVIVLLIIFATIGVALGAFVAVGQVGYLANMKKVRSVGKLPATIAPYLSEETGYWTFTTDEDFVILQLTDIHIGAGTLSMQKDAWAIEAVEQLVTRVKPNLVVISGDVVFSIPIYSTTNNQKQAEAVAQLLDNLGVYWTIAFGNHDSEKEVLAKYSREEVAKIVYENRSEYCLFQRGPTDIYGEGNTIINVENSAGLISQAIVLIDSNAYVSINISVYDNIHQDQIDWYEQAITTLSSLNQNNGGGAVKSIMYFHIPLKEYEDAYNEYAQNGYHDTADVQWIGGKKGEGVYHPQAEDAVFETILRLGSTQAVFCGHDHVNNYSLKYKGVTLAYGMSIDYFAYRGISKKTEQRGGTVTTLHTDTTFDSYNERLAQ